MRYVDQFCDAGADIVTCHVEADTQENILAAIDKIHAKGKKAGVVVKPRTPASAVLPFIDRVEMILVMTVEPGFGGQKFMADMMPKVQEIRRLHRRHEPRLRAGGGRRRGPRYLQDLRGQRRKRPGGRVRRVQGGGHSRPYPGASGLMRPDFT